MEKTGIYAVVKFIVVFLSAVVAFVLINANAWYWVFAVTVFITAINYLVIDLLVLPKYGNALASFSNGALAVILAYLATFIIPAFQVGLVALVVFGALVAIGEFFYRQYLLLNKAAHENTE